MTFLDIFQRLSHFFDAHGIKPPTVRLTFESVQAAHRARNIIFDEMKSLVYWPIEQVPIKGDLHIAGITIEIMPPISNLPSRGPHDQR